MYGSFPGLHSQITTLNPYRGIGTEESDSSYASNVFALPTEELLEADGTLKPILVESWKQEIQAWGEDMRSKLSDGSFPCLNDCEQPCALNNRWLLNSFSAGLSSGESVLLIVHYLSCPYFCGEVGPNLKIDIKPSIKALDEKIPNMQENLLFSLYQIDTLILIPEQHPAKIVLRRAMDVIMTRIALKKNPQNQSHFLCQMPRLCGKGFYCFKTSNGWRCGAIDTDAAANRTFQIVHLNVNRTLNVVVDPQKDIVAHRGIFVSTHLRPDSDYSSLGPEAEKLHHNRIVKVDFLFYDGFSQDIGSSKNSYMFTGDIDLYDADPILRTLKRVGLLQLDTIDEILMFDEEKEKRCFEEIGKIFDVFKNRLATQTPVTIPFFQPESERDKLEVISAILKEYEKDPDAHAKEIAYIAEQLNPSFSEEEVKQLIKEGLARKTGKEEFMVEPKAIFAKLCEVTKGRYLEAVRRDLNFLEAPAQESPFVSSGEKEKEKEAAVEENKTETQPFASKEKEKEKEKETTSKPEAAQKARLPKDEAEKRRRREQHKWEQYKERTKAEASVPSDGKAEPKFKLSPEDRATVDSIYKGQPLKSKEFKAFAMALLSKKVEAMGATPSKRTKGSHLKFHLKREGGPSTGMTFVIQHKKKDHHGSLKAQKDVLDHIFDL